MPFVRTNTALCPLNSLHVLHACKYVMQLPCKNYLISIILCIFCNFLYMFTKLTYQLTQDHSKTLMVKFN